MAFGSLNNMVAAEEKPLVPEVGMGATALLWTDRKAYTIVKVSPSGKTIWVKRDRVKRTDSNGMSERQDYEFTPDRDAEMEQVRLTKKGWKSKNHWFAIGYRSEYHDYSF